MSASVQLDPRHFITVHNRQPRTTSLKVAEAFGKRHDNVLRTLKALECSPEFHVLNFEEMSVDVSVGKGATRKTPIFEMTKDGFIFLVMGFTGREAARIKEAYINAFNWMAEQIAAPVEPSTSTASEPEDPDADFILLRYQGIKLRVMHMEGGYWYGAAALAKALGRRDAYLITGFLQPWQLSCVPCGNRHLQMISHTGMLDLAGRFREGSELLVWLERKIPHVFSSISAPLPTTTPTPEPVNPFAGVTGDARQMTFDYFNQCRQAVTDAGGQVPHWDTSTEQRIADGLAALLLERHRYLLSFGEGGAPQLKAVPLGSVVIDPADGDRLARLVWEQVPVEALPTIMDAACRRLARLVEVSR